MPGHDPYVDRDTAGPTRGLPRREIMDGLEVIRVPGWGTRQIAVTYRPDRIWREIARHDVVHVHDARFSLASCLVGAVVARRPRIFHTHGLIFHTSGGARIQAAGNAPLLRPVAALGQVPDCGQQ